MKYLIAKVLLESKQVFFCDFLLSPTDSLMDFHFAAIDFEGKKMASFLKEDEGWQAKEEFPLEDLGSEGKKLMKEIKIKEVLEKEGDQLSYIYDYLNEWKFQIEVVDTPKAAADEKSSTPKLIKKQGKSPQESDRNLSGSDAGSILIDALLNEEGLGDEDEEDSFDFKNFDSLDDYEEFN